MLVSSEMFLIHAWWGSVSSFGKRVGNDISNRPSVLYSLIGDDTISGQSIVVGGFMDIVWRKYLIFSISWCVLGNLKANVDVACDG